MERVSSEVLEDFSPSDVESVAGSSGFSVCVLAVPLSVRGVTVPFSPVHGDREVLFDSDCENVRSHTLSLQNTDENTVSIQKKNYATHAAAEPAAVAGGCAAADGGGGPAFIPCATERFFQRWSST